MRTTSQTHLRNISYQILVCFISNDTEGVFFKYLMHLQNNIQSSFNISTTIMKSPFFPQEKTPPICQSFLPIESMCLILNQRKIMDWEAVMSQGILQCIVINSQNVFFLNACVKHIGKQ